MGVPNKSVVVVYEGVDELFRPQKDDKIIRRVLEKYDVKRPFMFYCGSLSPRKNILRILIAFNEIKNKIPHNIFIAGDKSWNENKVREYIKEKLPQRVFMTGLLSDEELRCFYSSADLYLYPSLYEGFGLPILEAQACGCPVITSNRSSCPEIAGSGAVIVDPEDIKAIETAIVNVLNSIELKKKLIENGFDNKKRYDRHKCVSGILEVLKQ